MSGPSSHFKKEEGNTLKEAEYTKSNGRRSKMNGAGPTCCDFGRMKMKGLNAAGQMCCERATCRNKLALVFCLGVGSRGVQNGD